jgi:hypothetical protein
VERQGASVGLHQEQPANPDAGGCGAAGRATLRVALTARTNASTLPGWHQHPGIHCSSCSEPQPGFPTPIADMPTFPS